MQIYFPVQCHIAANRITKKHQKWWWLQTLNFLTLLITVVSAIGSVVFVVHDLKVQNQGNLTKCCSSDPDNDLRLFVAFICCQDNLETSEKGALERSILRGFNR